MHVKKFCITLNKGKTKKLFGKLLMRNFDIKLSKR